MISMSYTKQTYMHEAILLLLPLGTFAAYAHSLNNTLHTCTQLQITVH